MAAKAKLTIVLKADETVVAEIEDANLWQRVLGIINQGTADNERQPSLNLKLNDGLPDPPKVEHEENENSVATFAKRLGISTADLVGALDPSKDPPYLHLNSHNWEAFKKNFPSRGTGSVSSSGLVGTALALWIKEAKLDVAATQALCLSILDTIGARDPNASRGIKNTKWLQGRAGGTIIVNPAEVSKAYDMVRAFCTKAAPSSKA